MARISFCLLRTLVILILNFGNVIASTNYEIDNFVNSVIQIEGQLEIPTGELAVNVPLTLNSDGHNLMFETLSREDGSFVFLDVPSGIYSMDVLAIHQVRSNYSSYKPAYQIIYIQDFNLFFLFLIIKGFSSNET